MKKTILSVLFLSVLFILMGCGGTQIANPQVEYASVEEVTQKLGFPVAQLPADYTLEKCYIIDGKTADLRYKDAAGNELTVRSAEDTGADIGGVQNLNYAVGAYGNVSYLIAQSEDGVWSAYFTRDNGDKTYNYSMTGQGMDEAAFTQAFAAMIDMLSN